MHYITTTALYILTWLAADIILIAPFAYVSWKRYPEREREEQIYAQLEVA